jgi:hypothetical protein
MERMGVFDHDSWPAAGWAASGLAFPEPAKEIAMPAQQRVRLYDDESLLPGVKLASQAAAAESKNTPGLASQTDEVSMPYGHDLG